MKAYIACNLELEYALEYLMQRLEEAGVADKTCIVLTNDHYPYGLTEDEYNELAGRRWTPPLRSTATASSAMFPPFREHRGG